MEIKALWVTGPEKIEIRDEKLPEPGYKELQVETKAVGICTWDSYLYRGMDAPHPFPYRLGHEGVGVVVGIGEDVKGFEIGDKVFVGTGGDEMMATHFNVEYDCVAKIPKEETDYLKWVGEPAVCVVNILQKANINPGNSVVLVGAGYMGILTLQGLLRGSPAGRVTVFDISDERLEIAREYTPNCFNSNSEEGKIEIERIKAEGGVDIVIEFAGNQSALDMAVELTAHEAGKLVIGSWHRGERTFNGTRWHTTGLEVLNVAPKSNKRFRDLTKGTGSLIERGVYDTRRLVTHTAEFGDMKAMKEILEKSIKKTDGYVKGVITFG
ncbi:MAG: alcohol dehydrogenase catalytic domain-containing protein [Gudongella sp.]|nr:alcohol dehydrogenase catalytic domain-containing protein [Gudongella sp.]